MDKILTLRPVIELNLRIAKEIGYLFRRDLFSILLPGFNALFITPEVK